MNQDLTDRQTDRQYPYKYYYEKITGTGKYSKFSESPSDVRAIAEECANAESTRGGYDNKYRKLCGIGEYSKLQNEKQIRQEQSEVSNNVGMAHIRQRESNTDEYPQHKQINVFTSKI